MHQLLNQSQSENNIPNFTISGIRIGFDEKGRLCLNDLHKASGEGVNKRPNYWLALDGTKALIKELANTDAEISASPTSSIKGGLNQGTYAHELLAVSYAGWISPSFQLVVNQTFLDYKSGRLDKPKIEPVPLREIRLLMKQNIGIAKMAGLDGNQAVLSANQGTLSMAGFDYLAGMGLTALPAPTNEIDMTPTMLGRQLNPPISSQKVNNILCDLGMQEKFRDAKDKLVYEPTQKGKSAGAVLKDTGKRHGSGVPVKQLFWPSSVVNVIEKAVLQDG